VFTSSGAPVLVTVVGGEPGTVQIDKVVSDPVVLNPIASGLQPSCGS
jgi:hypothetical protein